MNTYYNCTILTCWEVQHQNLCSTAIQLSVTRLLTVQRDTTLYVSRCVFRCVARFFSRWKCFGFSHQSRFFAATCSRTRVRTHCHTCTLLHTHIHTHTHTHTCTHTRTHTRTHTHTHARAVWFRYPPYSAFDTSILQLVQYPRGWKNNVIMQVCALCRCTKLFLSLRHLSKRSLMFASRFYAFCWLFATHGHFDLACIFATCVYSCQAPKYILFFLALVALKRTGLLKMALQQVIDLL